MTIKRKAAKQRVLRVTKKLLAPSKAEVQHVSERFVLVYAGEHTAFSIREFHSVETLSAFIATNRFTREEYAIIKGNVKRCDPRYKTDASYKPPWDDGTEDAPAFASDAVLTTAVPLAREDVDRLLRGD